MCPVQLISGWQLLSVFHLFSLFTSPLICSLWRGKSNSFGFSLASNTTAYLESPPTIKFLSQCQWLCWVSGTCQELWSLYFVCSFYDGYQAPTEMGHVNNLPKDRVVSQCIGMNLFLHPGLRLLMAWWGKCEIGAMCTVQSESVTAVLFMTSNPKPGLHINNCPRDKSNPVPLRLCSLLSWFIHPGLLVIFILNRYMRLP